MTALETISQKLDVPVEWLAALINFESANNPAARNKISGARGLIQFIPSTAREMGFKSADEIVDKYPTFDEQLSTPVYNYLKKYKPFPTKQSLYMAVFYPKARNWEAAAHFPGIVKVMNPGIDTVQSYIDKVERVKKKPEKTSNILALGIIGILAYMIYKTTLPK